jgi:hypothetical protein
LMPALTPAARKPRGVVTPPVMIEMVEDTILRE